MSELPNQRNPAGSGREGSASAGKGVRINDKAGVGAVAASPVGDGSGEGEAKGGIIAGLEGVSFRAAGLQATSSPNRRPITNHNRSIDRIM